MALSVLSLEEDKVSEQSSDDVMSALTVLPVSSLAGSDWNRPAVTSSLALSFSLLAAQKSHMYLWKE